MSTVYFTRDISPEGLMRAYDALGATLRGSVAVKISTGEPGGHNFLQPALIAPLVSKLDGTIVECNRPTRGGATPVKPTGRPSGSTALRPSPPAT
ncbi:hypothetical protein [Feifania hominis]|uniref:hypothetical protein n=1 Tax=Feifania hominis TaxID=2763660 RepID=UPI003211AAF9